MILNSTIISKIEKQKGSTFYPDYDIRYLDRWIKDYPNCFPKFIKKGNYEAVFNWELIRWEIHEKI